MRLSGFIIAFAALSGACAKAPDSATAADAPAAAAVETAPAVAAETAPAPSPEAVLAAETAAPGVDPLTDRVWLLTPDGGRLGAMLILLGDGVMMQGSCGETYRLSQWRLDETGKIAWSEDGAEITADIVAVDAAALTISINLRNEKKVETYAPAAAPFVCPDLPR